MKYLNKQENKIEREILLSTVCRDFFFYFMYCLEKIILETDADFYFYFLNPVLSWYLEDLSHVLTVPLLGYIAQACSDVNPSTYVHVHLHGLLLDLTVQLWEVLMGVNQKSKKWANKEKNSLFSLIFSYI